MKSKQKLSKRLIPYTRKKPVRERNFRRIKDPIIAFLYNARKISLNEELNQNFAVNIFNEIKGKEVVYMCSTPKLMSFYHKVLLVLPPQPLEILCNAVLKDLQVICSSKKGQHIMQYLLHMLSGRVVKSLQTSEESEYSAEHIAYCDTFIQNVCNYLMQEFRDCNYCKYVIRNCIFQLAGFSLPIYGDYIFSDLERVTVPDKWIQILKEFCERILSWPNFSEMLFTEWWRVIIACIRGLSEIYPSLQKELLTKLTKESLILKSENRNEFRIFENQNENICKTILKYSDEKNFVNIYNTIFKSNLVSLSVSRHTSDYVRILINACKSKEQFNPIFRELQGSFEDILSTNANILVAMASACKRFNIHQQLFLESLSKAMLSDSEETSDDQQSLISKLFSEEGVNAELFVAIAQEILQFKNEFEIQDFLSSFYKAGGIYIAEILLQDEDTKQKTLAYLKGTFTQLAISNYGSEVLQLVWKNSNKTQRIGIMNELSSQMRILNSSISGRNICTIFKVELYKRSPGSWEENINNST